MADTVTTRRLDVAVPLWVPGDWNAFFGLFTNVILNVLVLAGLVLGVVKLPNDIVFGRILPALGWATGVMKAPEVVSSLGQFGLHLPLPTGDVVVGFGGIASLLVTAIPLGVYNFTEGMNNVESAAAVLSFFGLIHGTEIGVRVNLDIVAGYLLMGLITGYLALTSKASAVDSESELVPELSTSVEPATS